MIFKYHITMTALKMIFIFKKSKNVFIYDKLWLLCKILYNINGTYYFKIWSFLKGIITNTTLKMFFIFMDFGNAMVNTANAGNLNKIHRWEHSNDFMSSWTDVNYILSQHCYICPLCNFRRLNFSDKQFPTHGSLND